MTEIQDETISPGAEQDKGQDEKDIPCVSKPRFTEDTLNLFRIVIGFALLFPIVQLYFTIPSAISMWVADQYVPFVNMIYFIVIIIGGVWLIRYTFTLSGSGKGK